MRRGGMLGLDACPSCLLAAISRDNAALALHWHLAWIGGGNLGVAEGLVGRMLGISNKWFRIAKIGLLLICWRYPRTSKHLKVWGLLLLFGGGLLRLRGYISRVYCSTSAVERERSSDLTLLSSHSSLLYLSLQLSFSHSSDAIARRHLPPTWR